MQPGAGLSRAAQKRAKKKARDAPDAQPASQRQRTGDETTGSLPAEPSPAAAVAAPSIAATTPTEWTEPMPVAGSDLQEAVQLATAQAHTITGRKYRYGAVLLADDIVLRASSNKTPFQRDPIHAEMAAIKGCPRPEGKDVVLARLAPVRPGAAQTPQDDGAQDDGSGDDGDGDSHGVGKGLFDAPPALMKPPSVPGKLLNAKPCAACEAKMRARGIRRVYYTVSAREMGVMQLNADR
tara:strand:- start:1085 stop:1798 length:714 start_codon:yes stop_codon:yes gene_type:complete